MNRKLIASSVLAAIAGLCLYAAFGDEEPEQDMNDRIIEQTAKCVSAGMEPEVEQRYSSFGSGDEYFVVCKTPGGKGSNLDRLIRQLEKPKADTEPGKGIESRKPINQDSFEYKQKRTE